MKKEVITIVLVVILIIVQICFFIFGKDKKATISDSTQNNTTQNTRN